MLLGTAFCVTGLWISYVMDIASGAVIVILSVIGYFAIDSVRLLAECRRKPPSVSETGAAVNKEGTS
jgi:zinc transport system permease protein